MTQQHQSISRRRRRKTSLWTSSSSLTLVWLFVSLLLFRGIAAAATSLSSLLSLSIGANSLSILMMGIHATAAEVKRAEDIDRRGYTTSTSALGAPAPAITYTGDSTRPYGVENNTFTDYTSAQQRSCSDQFNTCQLVANDNSTADFTVSDCEKQQTTCLNKDEAVQVSSSGSSTEPRTTETTMVTVTTTTTSIAPASTTSTSTLTSTSTTAASSSTTTSTTAAPVITTTATASQASATQKTTITQDQYILICDV